MQKRSYPLHESVYKVFLPPLPQRKMEFDSLSDLSLSNLIKDPVSRRTLHQQWNEKTIVSRFIDSFSLLESFFDFESQTKRFTAFQRTSLPMLRIQNKKRLKSPFTRLLLLEKISSFLSTKRNTLFQFSCRSGDTRI